jgi:hypothetical protein
MDPQHRIGSSKVTGQLPCWLFRQRCHDFSVWATSSSVDHQLWLKTEESFHRPRREFFLSLTLQVQAVESWEHAWWLVGGRCERAHVGDFFLWRADGRSGLVPPKLINLALYKKKILNHIKLTVHVWSTKCRRNKKTNCTV